jgi:hypothetical protein
MLRNGGSKRRLEKLHKKLSRFFEEWATAIQEMFLLDTTLAETLALSSTLFLVVKQIDYACTPRVHTSFRNLEASSKF